MPRNATGIGLVCWLLVGIVAHARSDVNANTEAEEVEQVEVSEGRPIDDGFVIVKGEYLPPPYIVKKQGDRLFINGHFVPLKPFGKGSRERGGKEGGARRSPRRSQQQARPYTLARIEQHLSASALLIVLDDETADWIEPYQAIPILDVLLSDATSANKVESLANARVSWIAPEQWTDIVESFTPTTELADRVRPLAEKFRKQMAEDQAASKRLISRSLLSSAPGRYLVTLVAMGLVVAAFGNLLSHHPERGVRWRDVDPNGDGVGMVKRNVTLLILLGVFDLACTAVAEQAGGFLELNPLGSRMTGEPLALAAFKITTLIFACGILLTLRNYRAAQAASWWMCLVVTVVALRWLTYNSMFLT